MQNAMAGGTLIEDAPAGVSGLDFLSGDVMTQLWSADAGVVEMAAKKKPAKKAPAKKAKPKPRPTKNRPGCDTDVPSCATSRR